MSKTDGGKGAGVSTKTKGKGDGGAAAPGKPAQAAPATPAQAEIVARLEQDAVPAQDRLLHEGGPARPRASLAGPLG